MRSCLDATPSLANELRLILGLVGAVGGVGGLKNCGLHGDFLLITSDLNDGGGIEGLFSMEIINEETLVLLAIKCKQMSPILNLYCARRACDFYLKKADYKNVLGCYIDIINRAKAEAYYETSYSLKRFS